MPGAGVLRRFATKRSLKAGQDGVKQSIRRKSAAAMGFLGNLKEVLEHQQEQQREMEKQDRQLNEVLNELLSTEATYLQDLSWTVKALLHPLRDMLDARTHYTIFSNFEQLKELHAKLGSDLDKARPTFGVEDGVVIEKEGCSVQQQGVVVAEAFIRFLPFMKMYAVYCGNQAVAAGALASVREDEQVASFLSEQERNPEARATLAALLFRPVQRMCVYPLLFQQLLKKCNASHPQHDDFSKALRTVQQTVQEVNENVRAQEAHHHMMRVLVDEVHGGASVSDLLAAARTLEREAMVDMKAKSGLRSLEWRVRRAFKWYVFNDLLLVCRPNQIGDGFSKKMLLPMDELTISGPRGRRWRRSTAAQARGADAATEAAASSSSSAAAAAPAAPNRWRVARAKLTEEGTLPVRRESAWSQVLRHAVESVHYGNEKAEVLHLRWEGAEYKCWAQSADEMRELLDTVHALQKRLASSNVRPPHAVDDVADDSVQVRISTVSNGGIPGPPGKAAAGGWFKKLRRPAK